MQSSRFQSARLNAKPEYKINIKKNLAVIEQIYAILDQKGWTQKGLALALKKSESEISKWLSGTHNLTLLTISKIEAVLGNEILITPKQASQRNLGVSQVSVSAKSSMGNFTTEVPSRLERISKIVLVDTSVVQKNSINKDFAAKWAQVEHELSKSKAASKTHVEKEYSADAA